MASRLGIQLYLETGDVWDGKRGTGLVQEQTDGEARQ